MPACEKPPARRADVYLQHIGPGEPGEHAQLQEREDPEAEREVPMLRLVAKGEHPEQAARGAAEESEDKEALLRDAPAAALRPALVGAHADKEEQAQGRDP